MSRLRTSFRLSLEKLDDRRCLSGTTMETFATEPDPVEGTAHVQAVTSTFSAYGGFQGGVRVGGIDREGDGTSSAYPGFTGGVFVAAGDVDGGDLGNDWLVGGTGQDAADVRTTAALHLKPATSQSGDDVVVDGRVITGGDDWSAAGAGLDVLIANTGADRFDLAGDDLVNSSSTTSAHNGGANFLFGDGSVRF